jgi:hypothetical protein
LLKGCEIKAFGFYPTHKKFYGGGKMMNVIIVTIDENGDVIIDTNKVKVFDRNKYVQPIVKAIGNSYYSWLKRQRGLSPGYK